MSDPQALHVTRNVIPGKLGVDLHLHRVHIRLVFHIECLVAVCQPLIKLLLTYLLTYLHAAGIVSKRLTISSNFYLGFVDLPLPLRFSNTALWLKNSDGKGSLSLGWA